MQAAGPSLRPEDRQAIADVTVRYCWAIDSRDWGDLARVFTEDAEADFGFHPTVRGLPEIEGLLRRVLLPLDASQHIVANHQIESGEAGVRSRCYFHAQHVRRGIPGGANYVVAGVYRDTWASTQEGWRIRARRLDVLWTEGNAAVVGAGSRDS